MLQSDPWFVFIVVCLAVFGVSYSVSQTTGRLVLSSCFGSSLRNSGLKTGCASECHVQSASRSGSPCQPVWRYLPAERSLLCFGWLGGLRNSRDGVVAT